MEHRRRKKGASRAGSSASGRRAAADNVPAAETREDGGVRTQRELRLLSVFFGLTLFSLALLTCMIWFAPASSIDAFVHVSRWHRLPEFVRDAFRAVATLLTHALLDDDTSSGRSKFELPGAKGAREQEPAYESHLLLKPRGFAAYNETNGVLRVVWFATEVPSEYREETWKFLQALREHAVVHMHILDCSNAYALPRFESHSLEKLQLQISCSNAANFSTFVSEESFDLALLDVRWNEHRQQFPTYYIAYPEIREKKPNAIIVIYNEGISSVRDKGIGLAVGNRHLIRVAEVAEVVERHMYSGADLVLFSSQSTRDSLREALPNLRQKFHSVRPAYPSYSRAPKSEPFAKRKGMLFIAMNSLESDFSLDWLIHMVYPVIRTSMPEITIQVVGKIRNTTLLKVKDSEKWLAYDPMIRHANFYIERTRVIVSPIRAGTSVRTENLRAFSYGVPLVSTEPGVSALGMNEMHATALVRNQHTSFAHMVFKAYSDKLQWSDLSRVSKSHVKEKYSISEQHTELQSFLDRVRQMISIKHRGQSQKAVDVLGLLLRAEGLLTAGNAAEAIQFVSSAIENGAGVTVYAHLLMGKVLERIGDNNNAVKHYHEAFRLDPDDTTLLDDYQAAKKRAAKPAS